MANGYQSKEHSVSLEYSPWGGFQLELTSGEGGSMEVVNCHFLRMQLARYKTELASETLGILHSMGKMRRPILVRWMR